MSPIPWNRIGPGKYYTLKRVCCVCVTGANITSTIQRRIDDLFSVISHTALDEFTKNIPYQYPIPLKERALREISGIIIEFCQLGVSDLRFVARIDWVINRTKFRQGL